ncbi:MAG TPA: hypothetical protein VKR29_05285, partial [Candidatus Binataceae bacterium]|nr:hypothetical protein [Candidatus Binataceae bacterium]
MGRDIGASRHFADRSVSNGIILDSSAFNGFVFALSGPKIHESASDGFTPSKPNLKSFIFLHFLASFRNIAILRRLH